MRDATALLCESCGYPLDASSANPRCPECGRPIHDSLAARRTGSAWQRRPGLFSFVATDAAMLARPGRVFDRLAILPRRGLGLLYLNLAIASFLLVDPWVGVLVGDPLRAARGNDPVREGVLYAAVLAAEMGAAGITLYALTWIEVAGVQVFTRPRGWRVTREVAWQVCAHASVGWIMAGLFPILLLAVLYTTTRFFPQASSRWLTRSFAAPAIGGRVNVQEIVTGAGLACSYLAGLLWFEVLVYRGVRACRFANPPDAGSTAVPRG